MYNKNRSGVWNYMAKDPNTPGQIQCKLCKLKIKYSNNTSNVWDHLRRKHSTVLEANKLATQVEEVDDINVSNEPSTSTNSTAVAHYEHSTVQIQGPPTKRQKQLTLKNRFSLPPDSKVDQFNKAVVEMIAEDMQPLSIVENSGFRKLINLFDSRYKLPSHKLIGTTLIPNFNFNLKTYVLTTRKLESNHTAQYLSGVLTDIIREWKINTKVVAIVTDSGANIKAAIKLLGIDHIPCAAHQLNNAVKNALKSEFEEDDIDTNQTEEVDMMKLVKMCRSIVGHFKHSEVSTRILHEKQKQLNSPVLKLIQDIAIRWNSTLTMMERLLLVKEPLMLVSMGLPRCPNMPSNEQWQTINDFIFDLKKAAFTSNDNANDAEQEVQKEIADCIKTNVPERTALHPSVTQTTLTPEQLEVIPKSKKIY
ncbi:zinc finger BED domain-containing protein 1-like [Myzus persicae]|uniref:zinc finger BED domain-containing protein 1-like n=1 Tax=Myzus persicae TaxID=13164 RepID=UPI000B932636|nr:zinc finger BED domain-containing protein 1-like [Myzus persicae]